MIFARLTQIICKFIPIYILENLCHQRCSTPTDFGHGPDWNLEDDINVLFDNSANEVPDSDSDASLFSSEESDTSMLCDGSQLSVEAFRDRIKETIFNHKLSQRATKVNINKIHYCSITISTYYLASVFAINFHLIDDPHSLAILTL